MELLLLELKINNVLSLSLSLSLYIYIYMYALESYFLIRPRTFSRTGVECLFHNYRI
jgi:hypothetical protein